ncbi:MAG: glycosyltransferase family 4 protein [Pedobacter sp.]|nr:MAG: glycosyltransferase family 4 protein [Pedobacter sp.]
MNLKIALIADPEIPVPPLLYGGIERIIDMLISEYIKEGYQVTLFAHQDSKTPAKLIAYKGKTSHDKLDIIQNTYLINKELFSNKYDVIHCFGRLLYLLPQFLNKTPKIMSYQREPTLKQVRAATRLARKNTLVFTGCSAYISNQIKPFAPAYPIFNGVDMNIYKLNTQIAEDAPFMFLGRIEPIKGTHIAIEIAQKTGNALIIAGNIPTEYQSYFDLEIKPHLNDSIQYIGPVNDLQKNQLLGSCKAFLMPILWNEPFGIVMAEALACGTPVIGFKRGSVPEVVISGLNGYSCDTTEEMIDLIKNIGALDRKKIRQDAESRFSSEAIANQYLALYTDLINKNK